MDPALQPGNDGADIERTPSHGHDFHTETIAPSRALNFCHAEIPIPDQPAYRSNPTSFLDLPCELRIQIYPRALEYTTERRLTLKRKTNPNGAIHIKEPTPPLCHAIPQRFHNEVLAIYYAQNQFRIPLVSDRQRETFRLWVVQQGNLLRDLKALKLIVKVPFLEPRATESNLTSSIRLTCAPDGEVRMRYTCRTFLGCVCSLEPYVKEGKQFRSEAYGAEPQHSGEKSSGEEENERRKGNPIVEFAVKFTRLVDMHADADRKGTRRSLRFQKRYIPVPCERCGGWLIGGSPPYPPARRRRP